MASTTAMSAAQAAKAHKLQPRTISMGAPWRWLGAGWRDMTRAPILSFGYGAAFVAIGAAITFGLLRAGMGSLTPAAIAAFALVGPLMAGGLYEISRRLQAGEKLNVQVVALVQAKSPGQIAFIGVLLMVAFLVWARVAMLLYALFIGSGGMPADDFVAFALGTTEGLIMLVVGTAVGAVIAFGVFLMTALSIPMLIDREIDVFTAVDANVRAVRANTGPMLLWAWLIGITVAVGAAAFGLGLAVVFPLLGHATWHAYRDVFGAPPSDAEAGSPAAEA